mgnify:CR=1 FL=1
MILITEIQRINRFNDLISHKATGSPEEFAEKLHISKRQLFNLIGFMKDLGADIKYNRSACTYYYTDDFNFEILVRLRGEVNNFF